MPLETPAPLLTWPDLIARTRPLPDATGAYGPDAMQKVDVWLPAGKPAGAHGFPTVLMVHGGCWTTSIADLSLMNWIANDLRKEGIAVWNIDYRGVDRAGGGYPGTFRDAGAAADALAANARRFNLDARHVVAVGHSAGGHLALWLAARRQLGKTNALRGDHPIRLAHVISLGGLPDLEATAASPDNGCGVDVVGQLVGRPTPTHPDVYADTSVPRLLPLGVPQDLVNGREDRIVPLRLHRLRNVRTGEGRPRGPLPYAGNRPCRIDRARKRRLDGDQALDPNGLEEMIPPPRPPGHVGKAPRR